MNDDLSILSGVVHPRQPEDGEHYRKTRQNRGNNQVTIRPDPFKANVELRMNNIDACPSQTAGVLQRRPFNPNSELVSLLNLVTNGSHHGTNVTLIILSINSVSASSPTQVQQRCNGSRGQVNVAHRDVRMVVMCPQSAEGSNTAMILFGSGSCERFLTVTFLCVMMEGHMSHIIIIANSYLFYSNVLT